MRPLHRHAAFVTVAGATGTPRSPRVAHAAPAAAAMPRARRGAPPPQRARTARAPLSRRNGGNSERRGKLGDDAAAAARCSSRRHRHIAWPPAPLLRCTRTRAALDNDHQHTDTRPFHGDDDAAAAAAAAASSPPVRRTLQTITEAHDSLTLTLADVGGRRRRISGSLPVAAAPRTLWRVLTAYDEMAQFVPGLLESNYDAARQQLEQVALISRKLRLRTRLLTRVGERREANEIWFEMLESRDFSYWRGLYRLRSGERDADEGGDVATAGRTLLEYELDAVPTVVFPVAMVERKILKDVPRVLRALRDRAESQEGTAAAAAAAAAATPPPPAS